MSLLSTFFRDAPGYAYTPGPPCLANVRRDFFAKLSISMLP